MYHHPSDETKISIEIFSKIDRVYYFNNYKCIQQDNNILNNCKQQCNEKY